MPISGVVMAAGLSTRMGRDKLALPFGDTTMLGLVVRQAEASTLDEVIVVVGPGAGLPQRDRARIAVNPHPEEGTATTLHAGAVMATNPTIMLILGDMPGLTTAVIDTVAAAWEAHPAWAAVATYRDGDGHPFVLSAALVAAVADRRGDKVLWPLLEDDPQGEVVRVPIASARPRDVNTWEDYVAACAEVGVEPGPP